MDEIKRKVYLDIFASPGTLLPVAAGLTALIGSWAVDGNAILNFAGVAGLLTGLGVLATRLILGLDQITQRAYEHVVDRQRRQQEDSLERLHTRLLTDEDPRTQTCLQELRHVYGRLQEQVAQGRVNAAAYSVIEGVDQIFQTTVAQLEHSVELWETAKTMRGSARQKVLQQRDDIVREICLTVDHVGQTMQRFEEMTTHKNRSELARLREELDQSIQVARQVERRTDELTRTPLSDPPETE